jgi:hypothetical protein
LGAGPATKAFARKIDQTINTFRAIFTISIDPIVTKIDIGFTIFSGPTRVTLTKIITHFILTNGFVLARFGFTFIDINLTVVSLKTLIAITLKSSIKIITSKSARPSAGSRSTFVDIDLAKYSSKAGFAFTEPFVYSIGRVVTNAIIHAVGRFAMINFDNFWFQHFRHVKIAKFAGPVGETNTSKV